MVIVPYVLVECWGRDGRVARAALSATWAGVVDEGSIAIRDVTELLVIRNAIGELIHERIHLLDRQLEEMSRLGNSEEIIRDIAEDWIYVLEEAVPHLNRTTRAGAGSVQRVVNTEGQVRPRLERWIETGEPPRDAG